MKHPFSKDSRILVAGHRGLVGSALVRRLNAGGYRNLILKSRQELDLLDQRAVNSFYSSHRPEFVFFAAARVGGILANQGAQADFLYENLTMTTNCIHAALDCGVEKFLFLGSNCIYPKFAEQPVREQSLLTGPLEATNEGYAIAKIAGVKLCEMIQRQHSRRFVSAMPCNLYGPGDNFDLETSHVVPGLLRRFHVAKNRRESSVRVWGSGKAYRECMHVDDLADALLVVMDRYEDATPINIGTGTDLSIADLAEAVKHATRYPGDIEYDRTKPDGTPRKVLEVGKLRQLGWNHRISLEEGLARTYEWMQTALSVPTPPMTRVSPDQVLSR